ncbi:uncharacterized protein MELLADRAFT_79280 [Melampsora larici-populina 98AG31]|uniref:Uncharacterized protein n=1 Tax=Melampsora larici-populina (strain 98AG31 / pathotype 3-4-7) TaxID=747676 RepID=F4S503_MELLP|nr:uncharacterized protein MELLADRAFT_79280 [Melampsora larici-populina 98AG31]EGG00289.1 hypothetical protein MELLADRAFT_79280 [Melampsora larici-populina 98AG31]
MSMMSSTTTTSMSNNFNQTTIPSESNPSLLPAIRQQQQQQSQHRRSHSLNFAAALNRRASKRTGSSSSTLANQTTRAAIHTLPIIQPDTYWNSYQNSRHFKISLREPRQQVTSLLALSSIPRPITPPLHEDSEPSAATLIANVTRLVMEEEATNAAIAASLQTLENEVNVNGLNESDELDLLSNSSSSLPPPCHDLNATTPTHHQPQSKARPVSFPSSIPHNLIQPTSLSPIPDYSPPTTPPHSQRASSPIPSMDQDHPPQPPSSSLPPLQSPPTHSPEVFVIVRPPPSKTNHPLNLQVQLVLPTLPANSASVHQNESSNSDLRRTPSVRSGQSERSNSSLLSMTNSEASRRGRRVTPLYNLQWHTVLPTWISDAGTDAKIAKFIKKGIEIIDFAIIEPGEIKKGIPNLQQFNLSRTLSNQVPASNSSISSHHSITNTSENENTKLNGPTNWFKKIKTIGTLGSKRSPIPQPVVIVNEPEGNEVVADSDGALSSTGPSLESNRRAEGYVWMVRKWLREEAPESIVLIEWRKGSKPKTKKNLRSLTVIDSNTNSNQASSSRRHSIQVAGEAEVMDPNFHPRPPPSVIEEERETNEEDEEDESDAEDSERPWHCKLVVINQDCQLHNTEGKRTYIGSFTPQPHHPRIVGKLTVPWNLETIYPDEDSKAVSVEEMKDLIVITSMWLIVREELGGGNPNQQVKLSGKILHPTVVLPLPSSIGGGGVSSSSSKNRNRNSISVFGVGIGGNQNPKNQDRQDHEDQSNLISNLSKLRMPSAGNGIQTFQNHKKSLINWSKIGKLNP